MALSSVDHAIINRALIAASHEMGSKLIRSAHSPIVREAQDCSAAIINRQGKVVAQAELTAIQLGSIAQTLAPCLALFPVETIREGDFFINNDPYHGGQHIQDIFIFTPIFYDAELIGFSASVVHHIDLGGGAPGLNPYAGDVHQEGLVFPPTLYNLDHDWNGGPLERFITANVRMPDATIGDINAQFAANLIGAKRLSALVERYGVEQISEAMDAMLDYSERRVRNAIRNLPNGTYCANASLDNDGINETPIIIRTQVTIEDETLKISFDGTDPQVGTNLNCPLASTVAAAIACAKSVLTDSDIPFNDGVGRVIEVNAPFGSLLNPSSPAPVRARLLASHRVFNSVMKALAQIAPDKVISEGFDTTTPICLSRMEGHNYNIYLEILGGGYGAGNSNDGCDGVDSPLSNCANIPIESLEMDYRFLRIENYSLISGSGGEGMYRGGMGIERSYRVLEEGVSFATYGDRFEIKPEGLFGGKSGGLANTFIKRNGEKITLTSKMGCDLRKGDLLVVRTGGGAGYGDLENRCPKRIESDVSQGLIHL